jgi:hypothetical protein
MILDRLSAIAKFLHLVQPPNKSQMFSIQVLTDNNSRTRYWVSQGYTSRSLSSWSGWYHRAQNSFYLGRLQSRCCCSILPLGCMYLQLFEVTNTNQCVDIQHRTHFRHRNLVVCREITTKADPVRRRRVCVIFSCSCEKMAFTMQIC